MSDARAATIGAVSGLLGALAGAIATGYFTYKVALVQLRQTEVAIAATSALSVRATLADRAAEFFLANQMFLQELDADKPSLEKVSSAVESLNRARGTLSPLLDGDLLIACGDVAESAKLIARMENLEDGEKALKKYNAAYATFVTLYLRLRRSLEESAQLNLMTSQIKDEQSKNQEGSKSSSPVSR